MFSNISWFQYIIFICAAALIWYVAIFYIYYRYDLLQILQAKKTFHTGEGKTSYNFNIQQENPPSSPNVSQLIQSFTDEIVAYLGEAGKNEITKSDLLFAIGRIADKYSPLANLEVKESLGQFIKVQTETYCAMFLNEDDLNRVWRDS
jgi:hypothetical protein